MSTASEPRATSPSHADVECKSATFDLCCLRPWAAVERSAALQQHLSHTDGVQDVKLDVKTSKICITYAAPATLALLHSIVRDHGLFSNADEMATESHAWHDFLAHDGQTDN